MIEIAASILNSNLLNLGESVCEISGADWLHFDVMDGHFVPNLTFGPMFVEQVKEITDLPIEAHLMVDEPENFIPMFAKAGSKRIIIHAENTVHLHRLVQSIKEYGCEVGVVINPATPLTTIEYILADLDLVLLMTVNPGFGGQKLIPGMISKIKKLREMINTQRVPCKIEVDGGVNWENAATLVEAGVNVIVAGTLIFHETDRKAAVARLKGIVNKGGN
ncbi:MAG: ribulose-phosphate 3-epimerase [Firmicutes bacterium]|nr:ribulose-phosphate 3-epimerase [Bacillota bacterium]